MNIFLAIFCILYVFKLQSALPEEPIEIQREHHLFRTYSIKTFECFQNLKENFHEHTQIRVVNKKQKFQTLINFIDSIFQNTPPQISSELAYIRIIYNLAKSFRKVKEDGDAEQLVKILKILSPSPKLSITRAHNVKIHFYNTEFAKQSRHRTSKFVVKESTFKEVQALSELTKHLKTRKYPSFSTKYPKFVMPECMLLLSEKPCTLYHTAWGKNLFCILQDYSLNPEFKTYTESIFKKFGQSLYKFHSHFRITKEEMEKIDVSNPINIMRLYNDIDDFQFSNNEEIKKCNFSDMSKELLRYTLSVSMGDMQPLNIFFGNFGFSFIDYLTLFRDLGESERHSSIVNDLSYFIVCTRTCTNFRQRYKGIKRENLNSLMAEFLAGYLESLPNGYQNDILRFIKFGYNFYLHNLNLSERNEHIYLYKNEFDIIANLALQKIDIVSKQSKQKAIADIIGTNYKRKKIQKEL